MQSSLRDSVHQLLRDQIDLMGLSGFIVTDREIRHTNGSVFLFEGLRHNATKIKSLEGIDICWVEEAERISKESWAILVPTIRKAGSEIWVTFNPDQETDATYSRFILHPPKDCWQRKISWEDNPWLTAELREEKDYDYATDPEAADWIWGGNIRRYSAAQILKDRWIVQEFTVPRDEHGRLTDSRWSGPYFGGDFGFGVDPAAGVCCWIKDRTLYIEYEAYGHGVDIDDLPTFFAESLPQCRLHTMRFDSARPDSIRYLVRHGLPCAVGATKGAGSVMDGIAHLRSYAKIVIHPRCPHAAQEAKLYSYKVDSRSGDVLPIVVDKHNHIMDSLRYALEPFIRPRISAGVLFVRGERMATCPVCESYLPDDGQCPHCGAVVDMATGTLVETTDPAMSTTTVADTLSHLTPSSHTNGHANGHAHGNGHRPITLRDLNA